MAKSLFVVLVLFVHKSFGVIYRLDDIEYERMPPLIHIDDYENCFNDPDALYCTTQLKLVSDTPNELYNRIVNYSEWEITHYNHTKLYRGVCVRRSCDAFYDKKLTSNITDSLEACLNESLWKDYGFKTKLLKPPNCRSAEDKMEVDYMDILVAILCASILLVNVAGTLYDLYCATKSKSKAVDMLLAFSIVRNWPRLFQIDYRSRPPVNRLKGLDGIRAILMILLVFGHSFLPSLIAISNPHFLEKAYHHLPYHVFINGAIMVQAFFLMSGLLLSYSMQRTAEKKTIKWTMLPTNIWKRWLRLTPSFAVILAFTATLLRFMTSGPLLKLLEITDTEDCRRYWMWNLFYLENYQVGSRSQCMLQTWYLAADLHLYCLGAMVFVLVRNKNWRNVVLGVMFLIGVLTAGLVTYFYDLTFLLLAAPEILLQLFVNDPGYNYLYRPSHTNIPSFVIGLTIGVLIHDLQKRNFNLEKYKKYLPLYWATVPCCFGIILLNSVNFMDGPPYPLYIRVIYHTLLRPVTAALIAILVIGMAFKFENFYRGFLEWSGWAWVAQVSYGTYLIHFIVIHIVFGNSTSLVILSNFTIVPVIGMVTVSFISGTMVWLLIDAPVNQLVKIWLETPAKKTDKPKNEVKKSDDVEVHVEKL